MTSPPLPAVAAVRAAARHILFFAEGDGAIAAVAAFDIDRHFINKHRSNSDF